MKLLFNAKILFLSVVLTLGFYPVPSAAQDSLSDQQYQDIYEKAERDYELIMKAFESCDQDSAVPIDFEDVFDPPLEPFQANQKYEFKCVKFDAIASWRHLHKPDPEARYRSAQSGIFQAHTLVREHIGLENHDLMRDEELREKSLNAEVTGILATCGFTWSGYCHYQPGTFLVAKFVDGDPVTSTIRFVGERARAKLGNLSPMNEVEAAELGITDVFYTWLEGFRVRDREAFEVLVALADQDTTHNTYEKFLTNGLSDKTIPYHKGLASAFFDSESRFRQLDNHLNLTKAYFKRDTKLVIPEGVKKPWYGQSVHGYLACVCLENTCEGRWPISTADANLSQSTPYICTEFIDPARRFENYAGSENVEELVGESAKTEERKSKINWTTYDMPSEPPAINIIETLLPE